MKHLLLIALFSAFFLHAYAQQGDQFIDSSTAIPEKIFSELDKKANSFQVKLDKQTAKYLSKLQKRELKLKKVIAAKDSVLANQLFNGVSDKYKQLSKGSSIIRSYAPSAYSAHLDSLLTSIEFLKLNHKIPFEEAQKTLVHYSSLQSKFNQAESIRKYLEQRSELLKKEFTRLGMVKELKSFQKQAYYYAAQVREYKQLFEDPSRLEAKLLEYMREIPRFRDFFSKQSLLAGFFPSSGSANTSVALAGLQTRAMVNQTLIDRFGSSAGMTQQLQRNMQDAQGAITQLKNKLDGYKNGSYGAANDIEMPQGFKHNTQKTKSFWRRLEYGANLQSAKSNTYFPLTSDLGVSLGYKLSDKSSLGIGASYKLGWGKGWNDISLSHQGLGLRSYVELKLKGSFYISGGYERNYRSEIQNISQLKEYNSWQQSGLMGLSKKYRLKSKMKGDIKLLWDFLSYQQVPRTQTVVFRIGYKFK